jgi:hypothetical protein
MKEISDARLIKTNLDAVHSRMRQACDRSGRDVKEVKLLLATKTVSSEKIREALASGSFLIGENRIQEAIAKFEVLKALLAEWHMIGHLQSNKVKQALQFANVIQSVDRMRLAEKLQKRCEFEKRSVDIFIQVNTSYEPSKFGVPPEKAIPFIKEVAKMNRLKIKGLMTIGILSSKEDKVRGCFKRLKKIQQKAMSLGLPGASFNELSMGMSNDLEIAIEEGATIVRVGTAIFGKRPYPDSYYWNEK